MFVGLAVVPFALPGCATRGGSFPTDKIPRIQEHVTTGDEIVDWFGQPVSTRRESSGFSVYRYFHEEEQTRDTGTLTRIGAFIGRFFGFGGYGAPLNVRYRNKIRDELIVFIDPDGIVTSYSYERTEIPSKQIY